MGVNISKYFKALSLYFLYYAKLFPVYFSLQVLGFCFGILTFLGLLGILAFSGNHIFLLMISSFLAYPLIVNIINASRCYLGLSRALAVGEERPDAKYTFDASFIRKKIEQVKLRSYSEMESLQYLIFDTVHSTSNPGHLAFWSAPVNRVLFSDDSAIDPLRLRVRSSLKWGRRKSILRDWKARRALLMFHIVNGVNKGKIFSDDRKIGFAGCLCPGVGDVYPISFFDGLLTNGAAGRTLTVPSLRGCLDFKKLFPISDDGVNLKNLSECTELANYIGISTLLISGHHQKCLYIPRQSELNQHSAGLRAPSGSGSLDWEDLTRDLAPDGGRASTYSLRATVTKGMERELREELQHLVDFDFKNTDLKTQIIGYYRTYERAGKPEFVGITVVRDLRERSINHGDGNEVNSMEKFSFSSIGELRSLCEQLLEDRFGLSVPLRMLLTFLCAAIEDEEGRRRITRILC
jgi:hypothetical protein